MNCFQGNLLVGNALSYEMMSSLDMFRSALADGILAELDAGGVVLIAYRRRLFVSHELERLSQVQNLDSCKRALDVFAFHGRQ